MSEPTPTPPPKSLIWPIAVNLGIVVLIALFTEGDTDLLALTVAGLIVLNVVAAILTAIFKRMPWAIAFALSALVVPLIGFGLCALYIEMNGGLHGGH